MVTDPSGAHKGNLLIVDDTLPNLRVLAKMLSQQGYLVRGIPSGELAVKAAISEPPDLMLLDIMMPGMDGYEVCRRLKSADETAEIPIIFMSALDELVDKVKAFSVGAVDYITKPFQVEEVLARVEAHIKLQALQRELAYQVQALQESNAELDAFARTVAHDLKNPISNIVMTSDIITTSIGSPDYTQDDMLEVAQWLSAGARKAANIVDELLLLASVRQEDVSRAPVDMARVVSQAQKRLDWLFAEHQGTIDLPEEWPVARGYAPWIEEIWVNYLSNGLKYGGEPPRLRVGAKVQGHTIRYWVADNGPGIPQERLDSLFTEFTRLESTRAEGHGLGLSVVKRIAKKLGGSVGVESRVGMGSVFYFDLPGSA